MKLEYWLQVKETLEKWKADLDKHQDRTLRELSVRNAIGNAYEEVKAHTDTLVDEGASGE